MFHDIICKSALHPSEKVLHKSCYRHYFVIRRVVILLNVPIYMKLFFLVIFILQFAFRSAQITIHELHMAKARMQQLPTDDEESVSSYTIDIPPNNKSQVELLQHLRKMANTFDLSPMIAVSDPPLKPIYTITSFMQGQNECVSANTLLC